jgi:predicted hydrocarbon binding protein/tRNA A-37 threonylcarbamoyl transferase component Bud32
VRSRENNLPSPTALQRLASVVPAAQTHTEQTGAAAPADGKRSPWVQGAEFSRYAIDSLLASGGMAEVWRAKVKGAQGFEKRIVIKTMLTRLQHRPELVQMFIAEATIAAQLSHSHIVHVFDFGQLEGRYFIAMEYVPGVTLRLAHKRMVMRGERLPLNTALHVMMDVCDALEHVHEATDARGVLGLVHRDISPDNIIVSTSGSAKLIDFGAARATARTPPTPVFVGKYRYSAPERIRLAGEDRRSDVYSAGVILYECLAGKRPFEGTDAEVIKAALASPACDPRHKLAALPARVAEVVMRATAQNPGDRFASARELKLALAGCLEELGAGSKERDVTAALVTLLEAPPAAAAAAVATAAEAEAVPEPIGVIADGEPEAQSGSDADIALCEIEILEASGPIANRNVGPPPVPAAVRPSPVAPPLPPVASLVTSPPVSIFATRAVPAGTEVRGWRTTTRAGSPKADRGARERAVELYDRGLELRTTGRYGEALNAWEKALALAPDNRVYQSSVVRMRGDLARLRAQPPGVDVAGALRVVRPTLGNEAAVGLYRLLRLVAFDGGSGAEVAASARAAGEKLGRSMGFEALDGLIAFAGSVKLGVVEAALVAESVVSVAVRECAACAGLHAGGHAVCHFEGGLLAGAVERIFNRPVRVRETECIGGHGDDACRFEIELQ